MLAHSLAFLALTVGGDLLDESWFELADGVERAPVAFLREVDERPYGLQGGVVP